MSFRRGLYSSFLYLILPLVLLKLLWRSRSNPAYRKRISERLGFASIQSNQSECPVIWLHAVSVGEAIAAKPLIEVLLEKYPSFHVLVTTTTPTGSDRVKSMFAGRVSHVYFPYDLPGAVSRFIKKVNPGLLIVMETEIWPNLYAKCKKDAIPILIANARLSERSTKSYLKIKGLVKETLSCVNTIAVRSEVDSQRFIELGARNEQLEVVGNIKFDMSVNKQKIDQGIQRKKEWGEQRPVWIAASTHQGEDEIVLKIHRQLQENFPDLLLVIVPRHPERFDTVHQLCLESVKSKKFYARYSLLENSFNKEVNVILGDSMGELQSWYAAADVIFVGGSLVKTGGHNPLEATALAVPVVSGKYMFNFDDISSLLTEEKLMSICETEKHLQETINTYLLDRLSKENKAGFKNRADHFMQQHQGVTARLSDVVSKLI